MISIRDHVRNLPHRYVALLHRPAKPGSFIPIIDGLRFVAVVSVILYHINQFVAVKGGVHARSTGWGEFIDRGNLGVQLFFVISGFIIALPFAKAAEHHRTFRLRSYYMRRLRRLEPPYLINLVLMFIALTWIRGESARELLPHLGASAIYMHNQIYGGMSTINFVAWSLEIEFQFYMIAPFLALLFRIPNATQRRSALLACFVCTSIGAIFVPADLPRIGFSILRFFQFFLGGFLLAECYTSGWLTGIRRRWQWDVVGAAAWAGVWWGFEAPPWGRVLFPSFILVAYGCAFRGPLGYRIFSHPTTYLIGGMCYTLYLYHFLFISLFGNPLLRQLNQLGIHSLLYQSGLISIILFPLIILTGSVLFICTERPFMTGTARKNTRSHKC